jgi:hypothetical protein
VILAKIVSLTNVLAVNFAMPARQSVILVNVMLASFATLVNRHVMRINVLAVKVVTLVNLLVILASVLPVIFATPVNGATFAKLVTQDSVLLVRFVIVAKLPATQDSVQHAKHVTTVMPVTIVKIASCGNINLKT